MKLPKELKARGYKKDDEKKAEDIKIKDVTWKSDYKEDSAAGKYTFTAELPEEYKLAKDVILPKITIEIKEPEKSIYQPRYKNSRYCDRRRRADLC